MPEKFSPEFGSQDNAPSLIVEKFFKSLRDGGPIKITKAESEKYGLIAVGPISEGQMKFDVQGPRELTDVQQKAKLFVDQYIGNFIKNINEKNAKEGKRPIENYPKINISEINVQDDGNYEVVGRTGEISYGHIVVLLGEGLKKVYSAYVKEYSDSEEEKLSIEEFGRLLMSNVPGVCTLVITEDNNILLIKRNPQKVGTNKEAWHLPAGYVDDTDKDEDGKINPFVSAMREIHEEVGLTEEQIDDLICLGVTRDPNCGNRDSNCGNYEFLFVARTKLRSDQIVDKKVPIDEGRLLLDPKDIDGDIRPRKLERAGKLSTTLPALQRIEKIFGKDKSGEPGPQLTIKSSKAIFFLVNKVLKEKESDG